MILAIHCAAPAYMQAKAFFCCVSTITDGARIYHANILSNCCMHLFTLRWRHNERDSVSNHQPRDCLFNRLFTHRSKKTSKLRVTGLCAGNSPELGEFPAQRASNAEIGSIWWRHHEINTFVYRLTHWGLMPHIYIHTYTHIHTYICIYIYIVDSFVTYVELFSIKSKSRWNWIENKMQNVSYFVGPMCWIVQ